jgi:phage terminase large subunit-like protein
MSNVRRLTSLVIPPPAPPLFWMTDALRPLHDKYTLWLAEGRPKGALFTSDEYVEYMRLRGREDLYFFAKHICAFNAQPGEGSTLEVPFHSDLAWTWQAPNGWRCPDGRTLSQERMALVPRGHLKTTLLTQSYCVWRLIRNPEERILIYTHNVAMAEQMMLPIKQLFQGLGEMGQQFLALYGDIVPPRGEQEKWSATSLILKRRGVYTDPSIRASGVGSTLVGGHYTLQLVDDLVGDQLPRAQMDKVCSAYDNLTPMYANLRSSERRICGTRWAFFDPYSRIMRAQPDTLVALRGWCEKDGAPTRDFKRENMIFTQCDVQKALALRRSNPFFFSCQYDNNPRDDEKLGFNEKWFRYARREGDFLVELDYEGKPGRKIRLTDCNIFIFIDPTSAREPGKTQDRNVVSGSGEARHREGDFFGIIVLAVAPDNNWYVLRAIRKRWGVDQFVNETFSLVDQWSPKSVHLEQRAMQILYVHIFRTEFKRGRKPFLLLDWEGGNVSKPDRISGLQSRFANGMIYFLEGVDSTNEGMAALEGELLDYPNPEFDDLSDALSAALKKAWAPGGHAPRELAAISRFDRETGKLDDGSARAWRVRDAQRLADASGWGHWFGGDQSYDEREDYL